MAKKEAEPRRPKRKRILNLIYFTDSSRTRTMSFPVARIHLLLFCLLALIGWSVGSTLLVVALVSERSVIQQRLSRALGTVFDYETRYDRVYEIAYPSRKTKSLTAKNPVAEDAATAAAKAQSEPIPVASTPTQAESAPASAPAQSVNNQLNVAVTNPVIRTTKTSLEVTCDLTTRDNADKVEGYIWAVAEFQTDKGTKIKIVSPATASVDDSGELSQLQGTTYFAIRRFKKNSFSFPLVKGETGVFTAVRIGVADKATGGRMNYNVPIQVRVGAGSPAQKAPQNNQTPG